MLRFHRGQRGFTLVELLVVMAILAILAGIAVPLVLHFVGSSETKAAAAELDTVQAAIDQMMTEEGLISLTNLTAPDAGNATRDMTQFPNTEHPLYPTYLRDATTTYWYWCVANGTVHQSTSAP
jgi:prepilin-type N-terminal cleavage/methylation domain-containing protein